MSEGRLAVLIGCGAYPNEPKLQGLRCPERDVDGVAASLKARGAFTSVSVLKDPLHHAALLEINRTLKRATKDDLVLLYYSGHGKLDLANRLYLCTPDTMLEAIEATAIPVQSIRDYVDVASTQRVVLILDCCFSGAVGGVFARSSIDDQLQQASGGRGTYVMTASTNVQVALEKEQDQYSVFTKHVIQGLETEAADVDEDGRITMDELYRYVHDQVLAEGFQEPMKWAVNVRGDLLIARTGRSPREERRKRLRQKLLALSAQHILPDRVLAAALDVLGAEPSRMREEQRVRAQLLERFDKDDITVAELLDEWFRLDLAQGKAPVDRGRISAPPPGLPSPPKRRAPPELTRAEARPRQVPDFKVFVRGVVYALAGTVAFMVLQAILSGI